MLCDLITSFAEQAENMGFLETFKEAVGVGDFDGSHIVYSIQYIVYYSIIIVYSIYEKLYIL